VANLGDAFGASAADADMELVEGTLKEAWSGQREDVCISICGDLRKAGIPFKVSQHRYPIGKRASDDYFKIGVPVEFLEQAGKVIESRAMLDFYDTEEDQKTMEIPAEYGPEEGVDAGEGDDYESGDDAEEAKLEVWSGDAADVEGIEMALKENGIRARVDDGGKGNKKVSVAFEHEKRAREIVNEVVEGKPE
jgi:hypothetical protein